MLIFNDIYQVDLPVLENGQLYIYVLENYPQGNIKIGRTHHIQQRLKALSGSNSGGNKIIRCAISEPTWLYTLEGIVHMHFGCQRITGTEWFEKQDGSITFDMVVNYIDELFQSHAYALCNRVRCEFVKAHGVDKSAVCPEDYRQKPKWGMMSVVSVT